MGRFSVFLIGTATAWLAWTLLNQSPAPARKRVKASTAADQLRQAWADHHTTA